MVECLRCGASRNAEPLLLRHDAGECPRCGYVGWAPTADLTENVRRTLRERPPERRRLRVA
jgi:hypothetical protein